MLHLLILIHTALLRAATWLQDRAHDRGSERGSVTIENVLWAVAVIAFVGIVAAAIKAYVTSQAGNIR